MKAPRQSSSFRDGIVPGAEHAGTGDVPEIEWGAGPCDLDLWLVRHGATAWNLERRYCGWSDPPLDARGEEQALALKPSLAGRDFKGVWTSDLARARRTAELARGPAIADARLRELDFGSLEGLRWEDLSGEVQAAMADFDAFQAPGGESAIGLRTRVLAFLADLEPGSHLVFTHGGVIRALLRLAGREEHVANGGHVRMAWPAASGRNSSGNTAGAGAPERRDGGRNRRGGWNVRK